MAQTRRVRFPATQRPASGSAGRVARAALLLVLVAAFGCATAPRYSVQISALADPAIHPEPTTYVMLAADPNADPRSLHFREFAATVERALAERGFRATDDPEEAELAMLLDFGVGEHHLESITPVRPAFSYYGGYGPRGCFRGYRGYCGPRPVLGAGLYDPFYVDTYTRTFTTVNRFVRLEARRIEPGKAPRDGLPIWETRADSRGRDTDLRAIFPALVVAATEYIGTDTGQAVHERIRGDDERVVRLRARPGDSSAQPPVPDATATE